MILEQIDWRSLFVAVVIANILFFVTRLYISTEERRQWVPKYVTITDIESGNTIKVKITWKNKNWNWKVGYHNLNVRIIGEGNE